MNENWCALYLAIVCEYLPEDALKAVGEARPIRHEWVREDIEDIIAYRKQGMPWKAIGEIYGKKDSTMHHMCTYGMKRYGIKEESK